MAEIAAFRALRYDLSLLPDASAVLAPPYDVVSPSDWEALRARHANNVIQLELPHGAGDAKYAEARRLLDAWRASGVLRQDDAPAVYVYEQQFRHPDTAHGALYTRRGFFCRVRLTPFSSRVVLPHEKTLAAPKEDRRKLMLATRTQLSPVFGLHRDPEGRTAALLASSIGGRDPDLVASTADGCRHRLWVVRDAATIEALAQALVDKQVMIADGHHRYETLLNLRDALRPQGAAPGTAAADWGTMFLARAEDPGLLVLPTHRLVRNLPGLDLEGLRARASVSFDVALGDETTREAIEARLAAEGRRRVTFALRARGTSGTVWLGLKPAADLSALGPVALRGLDVTVLHGLLLGPLLGIDAAALAAQSYLGYTHDTDLALAEVAGGRAEAAFLMNATTVDQVLSACEAGFVLPQKSTYFQPKLATGLVMYELDGPA